MAQFIPFSDNVEVSGAAVLSFANANTNLKEHLIESLSINNILNPVAENWYSQKDWLNAFRYLGEKHGSNILFLIGKAILESAVFPDNIHNLEDALNAINVAYYLNHRNGEIGYYKLTEYNTKERFAIMECKNPYPSNFDRGIIFAIAKKFKPDNSFVVDVVLNLSLPSRQNGADSCTFRVSW